MRYLTTTALIAGLALGTLSGCSSHSQVRRDAILDRSADRAPDWVMKQTFERNENLYIVGEGYDLEGYPLAQRMAKAAAVQVLAEAVNLKAKSELTRSAQRAGISSAGSFIQDSVAMTSDLVTVQDLTSEEEYREKIARAEDDAIRYRVVTLYKLPTQQFKAAKVRALEAFLGKAVRAQDRQAEADAKRLLAEVKAE